MTQNMSLDEAITHLKRAVKYSEVKDQKHIDLSLCIAPDRPRFQDALIVTRLEVQKGSITEDELKSRLGID